MTEFDEKHHREVLRLLRIRLMLDEHWTDEAILQAFKDSYVYAKIDLYVSVQGLKKAIVDALPTCVRKLFRKEGD